MWWSWREISKEYPTFEAAVNYLLRRGSATIALPQGAVKVLSANVVYAWSREGRPGRIRGTTVRFPLDYGQYTLAIMFEDSAGVQYRMDVFTFHHNNWNRERYEPDPNAPAQGRIEGTQYRVIVNGVQSGDTPGYPHQVTITRLARDPVGPAFVPDNA